MLKCPTKLTKSSVIKGGHVPKGVPTGNPTNIVCWLQGGFYHDTVWGIAYDRDNLLNEIDMYHFTNPIATQQGVKILGITQTSPKDELQTETYSRLYEQDTPPAFAVYVCEQDDKQWEGWRDSPEEALSVFKSRKGYDLADEHLDPTNMPGAPVVVNLDDPVKS